MLRRRMRLDKPITDVEFALPPWDEEDVHWREIDERLPESHLARRIDEGVDRLDLTPLLRVYEGRGSPPLGRCGLIIYPDSGLIVRLHFGMSEDRFRRSAIGRKAALVSRTPVS